MPTSERILEINARILAINMLFLAVVYILAGAISVKEGALFGFASSLLQFAVNLVIAVIFLIIYAFQTVRGNKTESLSLSGTFFLSAILIVLLSVPICFTWGGLTF